MTPTPTHREFDGHATPLKAPIPATSRTPVPAAGGTASRPVTAATSNGTTDRVAGA